MCLIYAVAIAAIKFFSVSLLFQISTLLLVQMFTFRRKEFIVHEELIDLHCVPQILATITRNFLTVLAWPQVRCVCADSNAVLCLPCSALLALLYRQQRGDPFWSRNNPHRHLRVRALPVALSTDFPSSELASPILQSIDVD